MTIGVSDSFWRRASDAPDIVLPRIGWFWLALALGVGLRVGVFVYACLYPISNEEGVVVSPLILQSTTDFHTYTEAANVLRSADFGTFLGAVENPIRDGNDMYLRDFLQPLMPLLIIATDYREGNTLPLATVFLLVSCCAFLIWLEILRRVDLPGYWLVAFALLPTPLWFAINMTLDSLLSFTLVVFYFLYFIQTDLKHRFLILCVSALLIMMTRSNGIFLLGFLIADLLFFKTLSRRQIVPMAVFLTVIAGIVVFLFWPLYAFELNKATVAHTTFGLTQQQWLAGVVSWLPDPLDQVVSWLGYAVAKFLYFCGLRPSFADTEGWKLLLRAAPGLIVFPGLLFLFFAGEVRQRLFVLCYMFPIFGHLPQDRYSLAIQPLLFLYGARCFEGLRARLAGGGRTA